LAFAEISKVEGYNLMCIKDKTPEHELTFYLLTDTQWNYVIKSGIFYAPTADNNITWNHERFTFHKSGEKTRIGNDEYYYLDDIKVVK
jgi:hypothetical protein